MSLFRKVGKKFEETKREFLQGKEAEFICRSCEELLETNSDHCPHCGEATVEPVE